MTLKILCILIIIMGMLSTGMSVFALFKGIAVPLFFIFTALAGLFYVISGFWCWRKTNEL